MRKPLTYTSKATDSWEMAARRIRTPAPRLKAGALSQLATAPVVKEAVKRPKARKKQINTCIPARLALSGLPFWQVPAGGLTSVLERPLTSWRSLVSSQVAATRFCPRFGAEIAKAEVSGEPLGR